MVMTMPATMTMSLLTTTLTMMTTLEGVSIEEVGMDDGVGTLTPTPGTYHLLHFSSHH